MIREFADPAEIGKRYRIRRFATAGEFRDEITLPDDVTADDAEGRLFLAKTIIEDPWADKTLWTVSE
jgi:hypothetical protein